MRRSRHIGTRDARDRNKMLENFRLKVFRAVAEHMSFRKAGEKLYLSQPAVTLQIKALEDELGTTVFESSATREYIYP